MLREIDRHFKDGGSFAFETTLSGRAYLSRIATWQATGYRVELIFLKLNTPEEALARIAQRVSQGGHDVPEAVVRRRFAAGLENLNRLYAPVVDSWALYDNSGVAPILLNWDEK